MNKFLLTILFAVMVVGIAHAQNFNPADPNVARGPDSSNTEGVFPDAAKANGDTRCVECEMKKAAQPRISEHTTFNPSHSQPSSQSSGQKGTDQQ